MNSREVKAEYCKARDGRQLITISGLPGDGCDFTPAGLAELAKILSDMAKTAKQGGIAKAVRPFEPMKA
jgi:hypothetical protein